jgi:hypothetical protein
MKLFGKFVAGAMLLLMLGVPAMACVIPDAQLTEAEKACCRQMAQQCGKMDMPNGHSCCDTTVKPQQSAMLKPAPSFSYDHVVLAFAPIAIALAPQQIPADSAIRALRHPPPNIDSPSIEILRI